MAPRKSNATPTHEPEIDPAEAAPQTPQVDEAPGLTRARQVHDINHLRREERLAEQAAHGVFAHADDKGAVERAKDPEAAPEEEQPAEEAEKQG